MFMTVSCWLEKFAVWGIRMGECKFCEAIHMFKRKLVMNRNTRVERRTVWNTGTQGYWGREWGEENCDEHRNTGILRW